jgi:hypothetical protein
MSEGSRVTMPRLADFSRGRTVAELSDPSLAVAGCAIAVDESASATMSTAPSNEHQPVWTFRLNFIHASVDESGPNSRQPKFTSRMRGNLVSLEVSVAITLLATSRFRESPIHESESRWALPAFDGGVWLLRRQVVNTSRWEARHTSQNAPEPEGRRSL